MSSFLVTIITVISNIFFAGAVPNFLNLSPKVATIDPISQKLSQMTLEEKVRQTLVCSFTGKIQENALKVLDSCGNLIYSKGNTESLSELEILRNNQSIHRQDPLSWIMIDQEGGKVARIQDGSPPPRQMAEEKTVAYWGQQHGQTLKNLDFNVDLAPVADITENNPVIEDRSFADDPIVDGANATEYLKALQIQGIVGVIKHLPGHGRVDSDTHQKKGVLSYSWDEIKNFDLLPFIDAINNGAKIVMIGHISIPELDTKPASISPIIIEKLRSTLPGGQDLIFMTDSLSMKGVGLPQDNAAIEALKAGEDMLIIQGLPEEPLLKKILSAYLDGTLDQAKLDQAVYRILKLKSQFSQKLPN